MSLCGRLLSALHLRGHVYGHVCGHVQQEYARIKSYVEETHSPFVNDYKRESENGIRGRQAYGLH